MIEENIYTPSGQESEVITPKKPQKKKDPAHAKSDEKGTLIERFTNRWDKKRTATIIGIILISFSFYSFLACVSYLFTWQIDQSRILNKGFFDFLFEENTKPLANWNGKFGAWISHFFIYTLFGLPAFVLPFLLALIGSKLLINLHLIPIRKTISKSLIWMVWSSIFLGFFSNIINYAGGTFGFFINHWMKHIVGSIGAFATILVLLYITIVILHNPNFNELFSRIMASITKEEENEEESDESNSTNELRIKSTTHPIDDIIVINTIRDNEIIPDKPVTPVLFDDEIEDEFEIINPTLKNDDLSQDEFIVEIPEDEPLSPIIEKPQEVSTSEFVIEIPENDLEIDEKVADRLRKEYGDYDPTLDLASYILPPIDLLRDWGPSEVSANKQELEDNKNKIVETLSHYKIDIAKIKATVGPTVTLYEIIPAPGVRISKIKNLEDDIALSLSALGIRIIAPIPGKGTIGIEVPNSNPQMVSMRSLIASEKFQNSDYELPVVMGKTITNEIFTFDLTKMPHLLVAGATGQGKSVGLNAILISILYKKHPAQVKFVLVDPKKVELTLYNRIERHFLAKLPGEAEAIITDTSKVVNTLNSLCIEMDDRYELLKEAQVRTIKEYNTKFIARKLNPEKGHRYLPYIVVLIDEFADLIMTAGKEVEHPIARIAQLARAIGIHLIVATQRPSVNVITGMIKANFPARIAFRVLSKIDSRTILDTSGADQLIGRGDMLVSTGSEIKRLQCGFVDTPEVDEICAFIGNQRAYPDALLLPEYLGEGGSDNTEIDSGDVDPLFADAARTVVLHQQGSASLLQRKLKLGYNRAGRIVDQLEAFGIIGTFQGSKARDVLFTDEQSLEDFLRAKGLS